MDPGSIHPFDTLGLVVTAGDNNKKIAGSRAENFGMRSAWCDNNINAGSRTEKLACAQSAANIYSKPAKVI
jgi:hypothetical protein